MPLESDSHQELLLGLRYYSAETSRILLKLERLPVRAIEAAIATIALTFMVFYTCAQGEEEDGGVVWDDLPSLSRAGATMPAAIPFVLGGPVCAVLFAGTLWMVYAVQVKKLSWNSARRMPDEYTQAKLWVRHCMVLGMLFCAVLAAAVAVPAPHYHLIHACLVAGTLVAGALYASVLVHCVLKRARRLFISSADDERNYGRKWWLALGMGVAVGLDVVTQVVALVVPSLDCAWPKFCVVRAVQGGLEAVAVVCWLVFVHSLRHDLKEISLELAL